MFTRILVALDNSVNNVAVFETALSLAKWADARLMLAHVQPCDDEDTAEISNLTGHVPHSTSQQDPPIASVKQQTCEVRGLNMLREFHAIATAAGVGSDLAQPLANPGQQICELAAGWGADLIIVGRRGLTAADEALQGSVSQYVTHNACCPVLIVQHQALRQPDASTGHQTGWMTMAR